MTTHPTGPRNPGEPRAGGEREQPWDDGLGHGDLDASPDGWTPLAGLPRALLRLGGRSYADVLVVELVGSVSVTALARALRAVAARQPVLRTRLRAEPEPGVRVAHEVAATLPFTVVLGPWTDAVAADLARPFPAEGLAWRAALVARRDGAHLVLAVHHALVDGRSLTLLVHEILTAWASPTSAGPTPPPALATVSERVRVPWWMRVGRPALRLAWVWRALGGGSPRRLSGAAVPIDEPLGACFASTTIPADAFARVASRAREERATVGGALASAAWDATRALVARRAGDASVPGAPIEAMIDLRRWASPPPDVGFFTGGAIALTAREPASPWERARRAGRRLDRQLRWRLPLLPHVLAEGLDDAATWLEGFGVDLEAHGGTGSTAQVSNVGIWPHGTRYGAVRLVGAWSAASPARTGPALLVWLRTVDGAACLSAVGNPAVVGPHETTHWLRAIRDALAAMGER